MQMGELITKLKGEKDVYYLEYDEIPQQVIDAVISVEDSRFYEHNGIDLNGDYKSCRFVDQKPGRDS